ncbi:sodium:proton exchanger [Candidatus Kaiserbacteria bacterium]|nr:sodium:proton exchanger [Candidatus Kaiserbacteria bacterium]
MEIFLELSLILVCATVVAFAMRALRQPLIVGYIATGILAGPYVFDILHSKEEMELFSKIGVAVLLFIVGLSLNPAIIREVGKTSFVTGVGQVVFTSVLGFFILIFLGYDGVSSLYAAVALTFSSTIIILKLLTDRGDTGKLYGKVAIGFLLVQDLIATLILLGVTTGGAVVAAAQPGAASAVGAEFARLALVGMLLAFALYAVGKHILPRVVSYAGGNQEVLFVFSIAWGLGLSSLFYLLGFSLEIGALVAGVSLAISPFAYEIGSRMKPLRDFFILIFFVLLGAGLSLDSLSEVFVPAVILSTFVLVGNPIIVFFLMNLLGYRTKTAFMAGLTVAQISEFSLILVSLGYSLGHIGTETVSLVTLVGIVTIAGSTYLILYADAIYAVLRDTLELVSIRKRHHREPKSNDENPDIIIFGFDRVGHEFVSVAAQVSPQYLVVDYDPHAIKQLQEAQVPFRYGDAEDIEFLQEIGLQSAKLVVSSIPVRDTNLLLVNFYRKHNASGTIIMLAHTIEEAKELYLNGASYVVMPHHLGAHHAALMIARHGLQAAGFEEERNTHLAHLARYAARHGLSGRGN